MTYLCRIILVRATLSLRPHTLHFSSCYSRSHQCSILELSCYSTKAHSTKANSTKTKKKMSKHERSDDTVENGLKHPSTKRAKEIDQHTPLDELSELLAKQKTDHEARTVLHWFRSKDLREVDNKALAAASNKAEESKTSLITMYLFSPRDMEWHGTSPARSDFILEGLKILKRQLEARHIPLAFIVAEERADKIDLLMDFIEKHNVSHVYANFEYEVDELRRDKKAVTKMLEANNNVSMQLFHDQTVMEPGVLTTGSGGPHKVFTPYHKAWLAEMKHDADSFLALSNAPKGNDDTAKKTFKDLFASKAPDLPESKQFSSKDEEKRIRKLWPPGHDAGLARLEQFLNKKVKDYAVSRSNPAKDNSSRLSPYFATGMISAREACAAARKHNNGANFDESGDPGIAAWVRELVFREFYRQMLVVTPHNAMNLPQNLKFNFVQWESDEEGWKKWCEGKTGYPFVDAGMRQINHEAYMHNRLRMNVASFLRTNLLIDYRRGERYFAEHLIDWDLANNTQGWEPSYTVFNPITQAEKNDPNGDYIRRWVPELKDVEGKAVFMPFDRLSTDEFQKLGYPEPHVDFAESKERALGRYKQDLADADP